MIKFCQEKLKMFKYNQGFIKLLDEALPYSRMINIWRLEYFKSQIIATLQPIG